MESVSQTLVGKDMEGKEKREKKKKIKGITPVKFPMHFFLFSQISLVHETDFILQTKPK